MSQAQGIRKRWLERGQSSKEQSPLPLEIPEIDESFLHVVEAPLDWSLDERGMPIFDADLEDSAERHEADGWSFVGDSEAREAPASSNKRPRVQIEDISESPNADNVANEKRSATSQGVEHLALKTSNLGQFKFPWEKKRLAGSVQLAKLEPPSLQPGAHSLLSLSIQVKSNAELQPVVKADGLPTVMPAFCKVVKDVDDLNYVDEREKRRSEAITAWWDLLVTSISNSTVGRQATVDATSDTIATVGRELLDACFSLKSPGTLWKRLYGIKVSTTGTSIMWVPTGSPCWRQQHGDT